jgi:two-component system, NarL family, nitrate/nitrite sensor histidine kinase NarX
MPARTWSLSHKLGAIGGVLLLLALASIGLTLWVTWQLEGGAAAVNEAGRLRMQTWRLAQALQAPDTARQRELVAAFDTTLRLLHEGDPARPLFVPRDPPSRAGLAQVQAGWAQLRQRWLSPPAPAPQEAALQAGALVEQVDTLVSAIEHQLSWLTAALNLVQFLMVALAIASAVALLYSAYLFVFNPLARLQQGLARAEQGDLAVRVAEDSHDEFGALARGFNRMAERLQGLYQNLEAKVQEKTRRLDVQRHRLAALYEASAFAASAATLPELAQGFARQLRRVAAADASAVRWCDEGNHRFVLLASDCLATAVSANEACIDTAHCHCGQAQQGASTRTIRIVPSSTPLGHCQQAGYETVVSVPLRLQERLVGEVDLFYRAAARLDGDDRELVEALASHLAGAIEALKASALVREAAVAEERALLARELHDSIAQGLAFLKIQVGLLRAAVQQADPTRTQHGLAELDAGVQESLADVRELLLHFRTRTNEEDFGAALRTTLRKFEHQTGLPTQLEVLGHGLPMPADVQVQVLHVVQEALSNVRKHAGASHVAVSVQQAAPWSIEVLDDGIGFSGGSAGDSHVGLRIMQERAARIGAAVLVRSAPGQGTCVRLTLAAAAQPATERMPA